MPWININQYYAGFFNGKLDDKPEFTLCKFGSEKSGNVKYQLYSNKYVQGGIESTLLGTNADAKVLMDLHKGLQDE